MLAIMLAGGVPPQVAGWALDRLALYIGADAYEGSLYRKRQARLAVCRVRTSWRATSADPGVLQNLPADQFPTITTHVDELMAGDGDQRFEFGLDMLIRSLATYVDEGRRSRDGGPRSRT